MNRAGREHLVITDGQDNAALVFDRQIASATNGQASGSCGNDLDKRVWPGVHAFPRQSGDRQRAVVEHADCGIDSPIAAGGCELHELAGRKGTGRRETQDLPPIEGRRSASRAFRHDEIDRAPPEECHGDWIVLALVRLQPRKKDRREQLIKFVVGDFRKASAL